MSAVNKEQIINLYTSGLSITEVSQEIGKSLSAVRYHLNNAGVLRSRNEGIRIAADKGKFSHSKNLGRKMSDETKKKMSEARLKWAEKNAKGTYINGKGYEEYTRGERKGVSVHVATIERRIGRKLLPDECVHHIDGDKTNNEENNLALLTKSGHSRLHRFEDALAGNLREREENGRFC